MPQTSGITVKERVKSSPLLLLGYHGGLSLALNVEQYYYMRAYYLSAGVHVLVSEPSESKTLLETRGLSVSVGTHTTLSISQNRVSSECYLSDITLMVNHDFH